VIREPPPAEMTTVVAPVPFAEPTIAALRAAHDWSARRGVPAHITLLGPFLAPSDVTFETLVLLRRVFAARQPLAVALSELRVLGSSACLIPEPIEPLRALSDALCATWRGLTPKSDQYHVTVARNCDGALFDQVAAELRPALPLRGYLTEAALVERHVNRSVRTKARFSLGG
jgi:hypothetical protein